MKYFFLIAFLCAVSLVSCQKDFTVSNTNNPVNSFADDTSKIITIVQYEFDGFGVIIDSTTNVFKNATLNGEKKNLMTQTSLSSPADTARIVYKYNSQAQLTEMKFTMNNGPLGDWDKIMISRSGNKVTKIEDIFAGTVMLAYTYNYTPSGINTKMTISRFPDLSPDTLYHPNGAIQ